MAYRRKEINLGPKSLGILLGVLIAPLGFLGYMYYLGKNFNDPLFFLTAQPVFGAERSSEPFILLPQVFYRYAKILLSVPVSSYPFFTALLEVGFTLGALVLLILSFRRARLSYWLFSFLTFIVPTLTGTLSSMPRYVLMLFPLLPFITQKNSFFKLVLTLFIIAQVILTGLFTRGYWVS